jgi:hypothetical protein
MTDWAADFEGKDVIRDGGSSARGLQSGALVLAAAALLWLLGFVTGLVPWLGYREYDYRSGSLDVSEKSGFGTSAMLLFKGQTAYIDYQVDGDPGRAIYLDVSPWPGIKFSDRMRRATIGEAGRAEFPVGETGVYHFKATPTPDSYRETLRYRVSWGAK